MFVQPLSQDGYDWIKRDLFESEEPRDGRFGQIAVARRFVTREQLEECLSEQRRRRSDGRETRIGEILLRHGFLSVDQVLAIAKLQNRGRLSCPKCRQEYDIAGSPSDVRLRCLKCGDELSKSSCEEGEPAPTPYGILREPTGASRLRLGKYLLRREIARGGMGIVFEAEDPELRRRVALKVLKEGEWDPAIVPRLHREAAIAAQLSHPNIVAIHEVGMVRNADGLPTHFIVMDYVEGATLEEAIREGGRDRLLRMLEDVARAAAYAHSRGVVHRDLKPSNVLVDPAGRVLLSDFGLARSETFATRLTRTRAVLGTPQYMAPEQVEGRAHEVGPRTDVYALGVILYEILTGRLPFEGDTPARLYERILHKDPVPPKIDPELDVICLKALEKAVPDRYRSATEFADDLRRFREGESIRARPPAKWRRFLLKARRHRSVSWTIGVLLAAGGLAIAWLAIRHQDRLNAERKANHQWAALRDRIEERNREFRQLRLPAEPARRRLEEAVREADDRIRTYPDDPRGYYLRARGNMYLGELPEAERDLKIVLEKNPDFGPGWGLLGIVKLEECQTLYGTPHRSETLQRKRAELLSEAAAHLARGRMDVDRWGLPHAREDQVQERLIQALLLYYRHGSEEESRRLLEVELRNYQAEEYAGWLGILSADPRERIEWQNRAIAWAPGFAKAYFNRGMAHASRGDPASAVADYTQAIALRPRFVEAMLNRGAAYEAQGNYLKAISDYDEALRIRPTLAEAYCNRGAAKHALGDYPGARIDLDCALQLQPDLPEALVNRGLVRAALSDSAGAIADYSSAIALRNDIPEVYYNRGSLRHRMDDLPGAIADYDRALELHPGYVKAWHARGLARRSRGEFAEAIRDFETALRTAPPEWPHRASVQEMLDRAREAIPKP